MIKIHTRCTISLLVCKPPQVVVVQRYQGTKSVHAHLPSTSTESGRCSFSGVIQTMLRCCLAFAPRSSLWSNDGRAVSSTEMERDNSIWVSVWFVTAVLPLRSRRLTVVRSMAVPESMVLVVRVATRQPNVDGAPWSVSSSRRLVLRMMTVTTTGRLHTMSENVSCGRAGLVSEVRFSQCRSAGAPRRERRRQL